MKIQDYINSGLKVLNNENIWTLDKYEKLLNNLVVKYPQKFCRINYIQETIHNRSFFNDLTQCKNKTLLLSNLDIDFPPPQPPYEYDMFFDPKKLPPNYENIPYANKIDKDIISFLEQNNIMVFAHAVSVNHPLIQMIPGGIFRRFNHFHFKTSEKRILCYANFGLNCDRWFGNPRNIVLNDIRNKDFIVKENIICTEVVRRDFMNYDHFYKQISQSKFAICPRGCGIDTYRLWDCICLGCIPIVEKYGGYVGLNELPILFVESIEDYGKLTEEYLNEKYEEFLNGEFDYSKLTFNYWENAFLTK